jgi:thiamine kinase-like enzyme
VDTHLFSSPTIIHGEFYPHNVLLSDGQIYPIDWESAAIAAGEIDLSALTEAWRPEHRRQCELAYQEARWGRAAPAEFERALAAARLYLCFRWMGEQPGWTLGAGHREYFDRMQISGEQLGLI